MNNNEKYKLIRAVIESMTRKEKQEVVKIIIDNDRKLVEEELKGGE